MDYALFFSFMEGRELQNTPSYQPLGAPMQRGYCHPNCGAVCGGFIQNIAQAAHELKPGGL